jgi:hypothetical protein
MSDLIPTPFDAAIDLLRDRERALDKAVQDAIVRRDELRATIALLMANKPRAPRKPRVVQEAANDTAEETTRPTVFVVPPSAEAA